MYGASLSVSLKKSGSLEPRAGGGGRWVSSVSSAWAGGNYLLEYIGGSGDLPLPSLSLSLLLVLGDRL